MKKALAKFMFNLSFKTKKRSVEYFSGREETPAVEEIKEELKGLLKTGVSTKFSTFVKDEEVLEAVAEEIHLNLLLTFDDSEREEILN